MKTFIAVSLLQVFSAVAAAQEENTITGINEQQLENQAAGDDVPVEDDSYWQYLEYLRKHPLNINEADEEMLASLQLLSDLQINSLLQYRQSLGNLLSVYELQAVPFWDITAIHAVLPFITVREQEKMIPEIRKRLYQGDQQMVFRFSEILEKAKGYNNDGNAGYTGSRPKLFFRYRYNNHQLLQYGITADKDAGEQFFRGAQKAGFDFYSFHFFARGLGNIKALAAGDFTVNLGQGLIQWQGWALHKSADITGIKRQGAVLKPYTAAGEFNFHRGLGVTWQKNRLQATGFISSRKLSANVVADNAGEYVSSLLTSGYHRTRSELNDRHVLKSFVAGGNIRYQNLKGYVGINAVYYRFGKPLRASEDPYDRFAISGNTWYNYSMDYSYTFKNIHVFGELAADKNRHMAMVNGFMISLHPKAEFSLLHRAISKAYQSLYSNAFTESTMPSNESGLYTGLSVRPAPGWKIAVYADVYRFPWLKYRVDAPSSGRDYFFQLQYTPKRQVEIYCRFRNEVKAVNHTGTGNATHPAESFTRQNWRTQVSYRLNRNLLLRTRVELVKYGRLPVKDRETGFLCFTEMAYKPSLYPWSVTVRWQYFEAESYNARIYAYEHSVLYSFSIPAFFNRGLRYYINMRYKLPLNLFGQSIKARPVQLGLHFAQSVYTPGTTIGSGMDLLEGRTRTEIRCQVLIQLR